MTVALPKSRWLPSPRAGTPYHSSHPGVTKEPLRRVDHDFVTQLPSPGGTLACLIAPARGGKISSRIVLELHDWPGRQVSSGSSKLRQRLRTNHATWPALKPCLKGPAACGRRPSGSGRPCLCLLRGASRPVSPGPSPRASARHPFFREGRSQDEPEGFARLTSAMISSAVSVGITR